MITLEEESSSSFDELYYIRQINDEIQTLIGYKDVLLLDSNTQVPDELKNNSQIKKIYLQTGVKSVKNQLIFGENLYLLAGSALTFPGKNIYIYAKSLSVIGADDSKAIISVNGSDCSPWSESEKKASNEGKAIPKKKDFQDSKVADDGDAGSNGTDGKDGGNGEEGGKVEINILSFNIESDFGRSDGKLLIMSNGGNGQDGQDGADGLQGGDGGDNSLFPILREKGLLTGRCLPPDGMACISEDTISDKPFPNDQNPNEFMSKGGNGGNGGKGGNAGTGGNPGSIIVLLKEEKVKDKIIIQTDYGRDGAVGKGGTAGKAGLGGNALSEILHNQPAWTDKRRDGQDGSNGNDGIVPSVNRDEKDPTNATIGTYEQVMNKIIKIDQIMMVIKRVKFHYLCEYSINDNSAPDINKNKEFYEGFKWLVDVQQFLMSLEKKTPEQARFIMYVTDLSNKISYKRDYYNNFFNFIPLNFDIAQLKTHVSNFADTENSYKKVYKNYIDNVKSAESAKETIQSAKQAIEDNSKAKNQFIIKLDEIDEKITKISDDIEKEKYKLNDLANSAIYSIKQLSTCTASDILSCLGNIFIFAGGMEIGAGLASLGIGGVCDIASKSLNGEVDLGNGKVKKIFILHKTIQETGNISDIANAYVEIKNLNLAKNYYSQILIAKEKFENLYDNYLYEIQEGKKYKEELDEFLKKVEKRNNLVTEYNTTLLKCMSLELEDKKVDNLIQEVQGSGSELSQPLLESYFSYALQKYSEAKENLINECYLASKALLCLTLKSDLKLTDSLYKLGSLGNINLDHFNEMVNGQSGIPAALFAYLKETSKKPTIPAALPPITLSKENGHKRLIEELQQNRSCTFTLPPWTGESLEYYPKEFELFRERSNVRISSLKIRLIGGRGSLQKDQNGEDIYYVKGRVVQDGLFSVVADELKLDENGKKIIDEKKYPHGKLKKFDFNCDSTDSIWEYSYKNSNKIEFNDVNFMGPPKYQTQFRFGDNEEYTQALRSPFSKYTIFLDETVDLTNLDGIQLIMDITSSSVTVLENLYTCFSEDMIKVEPIIKEMSSDLLLAPNSFEFIYKKFKFVLPRGVIYRFLPVFKVPNSQRTYNKDKYLNFEKYKKFSDNDKYNVLSEDNDGLFESSSDKTVKYSQKFFEAGRYTHLQGIRNISNSKEIVYAPKSTSNLLKSLPNDAIVVSQEVRNKILKITSSRERIKYINWNMDQLKMASDELIEKGLLTNESIIIGSLGIVDVKSHTIQTLENGNIINTLVLENSSMHALDLGRAHWALVHNPKYPDKLLYSFLHTGEGKGISTTFVDPRVLPALDNCIMDHSAIKLKNPEKSNVEIEKLLPEHVRRLRFFVSGIVNWVNLWPSEVRHQIRIFTMKGCKSVPKNLMVFLAGQGGQCLEYENLEEINIEHLVDQEWPEEFVDPPGLYIETPGGEVLLQIEESLTGGISLIGYPNNSLDQATLEKINEIVTEHIKSNLSQEKLDRIQIELEMLITNELTKYSKEELESKTKEEFTENIMNSEVIDQVLEHFYKLIFNMKGEEIPGELYDQLDKISSEVEQLTKKDFTTICNNIFIETYLNHTIFNPTGFVGSTINYNLIKLELDVLNPDDLKSKLNETQKKIEEIVNNIAELSSLKKSKVDYEEVKKLERDIERKAEELHQTEEIKKTLEEKVEIHESPEYFDRERKMHEEARKKAEEIRIKRLTY